MDVNDQYATTHRKQYCVCKYSTL